MAFFSMLGTAVKSLLRKPATRLYPFVKRQPFERSRGNLVNHVENCIFCGVCQLKCPSKAITVTRAEKTWKFDRLRCIVCGRCVEVCPKKCLEMKNDHSSPVGPVKEDSIIILKGQSPEPQKPAAQ